MPVFFGYQGSVWGGGKRTHLLRPFRSFDSCQATWCFFDRGGWIRGRGGRLCCFVYWISRVEAELNELDPSLKWTSVMWFRLVYIYMRVCVIYRDVNGKWRLGRWKGWGVVISHPKRNETKFASLPHPCLDASRNFDPAQPLRTLLSFQRQSTSATLTRSCPKQMSVRYACSHLDTPTPPLPPSYPSSRPSFFPIEQLYFCEECDAVRCDLCVGVEVASYFCPNCLFDVPGANVRGDKNRWVGFSAAVCLLVFTTWPRFTIKKKNQMREIMFLLPSMLIEFIDPSVRSSPRRQ